MPWKMSSKRSREEEASWCTIESDPGIFTLFIEKLGVKGVQVEEIYDLESSDLSFSPFGFIFLFKWSKEGGIEGNGNFVENNEIFFAQQEITNACATQAILHILLNSPGVELGEVLENFKSFSHELPLDLRGLCLSNSLEIRQIHNEFGNLTGLLAFGDDDDEAEEKKKENLKDPFHFVAFIQKNGQIFELDGLKEFPILHDVAEIEGQNWQKSVLEIIKKRVDSGEIRFNLMAVCPDRRESLKSEIANLAAKLDESETEGTGERTPLLIRKFQAQQELDEEEAKWLGYRKDWADRQNECIRAVNQPKSAKDVKISSQVQDLLKSMTEKGLIPK